MTQYTDPYDTADNAELPASETWGELAVDAWFCVLQKGSKPVPFNPQVHKVEDRRTQIELNIVPLPEMGLSFSTQRKMLSESREWAGIVWQSLKDLGVKSVREVNSKWTRVELVSTGRTYEKDGVKKEATTIKFLAVFDSEDACRAAYLAEHPNRANSNQAPQQASTTATAQRQPSPSDQEKATALKFLEVLVAQSGGDEAKLASQMVGMPLITKFFAVQSPEVQAMLEPYRQPAAPF